MHVFFLSLLVRHAVILEYPLNMMKMVKKSNKKIKAAKMDAACSAYSFV